MNKTALQMKPDELRRFIPEKGLLLYRKKNRNMLLERRYRAWNAAKRAADILKKLFQAQKVFVFGSLVTDADFTEWSDIDLAAWGIPDSDYYKAVAAVTGMSSDFEIELINPETCCDALRKTIQEKGIEI